MAVIAGNFFFFGIGGLKHIRIYCRKIINVWADSMKKKKITTAFHGLLSHNSTLLGLYI